MKHLHLILLIFTVVIFSCKSECGKGSAEIPASAYNADLAEKLNADEFGMSRYVMAFLKRGPNRSQDSITAANLQKAHLDNIGKLAKEGKLVLAGPFFGNGDIRGIYIFDVKTIEEARVLTASDPAIQAGSLVMELHPWYGSAALKKVNEIHQSLQKMDIASQ